MPKLETKRLGNGGCIRGRGYDPLLKVPAISNRLQNGGAATAHIVSGEIWRQRVEFDSKGGLEHGQIAC